MAIIDVKDGHAFITTNDTNVFKKMSQSDLIYEQGIKLSDENDEIFCPTYNSVQTIDYYKKIINYLVSSKIDDGSKLTIDNVADYLLRGNANVLLKSSDFAFRESLAILNYSNGNMLFGTIWQMLALYMISIDKVIDLIKYGKMSDEDKEDAIYILKQYEVDFNKLYNTYIQYYLELNPDNVEDVLSLVKNK